MDIADICVSESMLIYKMLVAQARQIMRVCKPCEVITHDGKTTCVNGRAEGNDGFCCGGCEYLGETGCKVDALWCICWTCARASKNLQKHEEADKKMSTIRCFHSSMYFPGDRYSASDTLRMIDTLLNRKEN